MPAAFAPEPKTNPLTVSRSDIERITAVAESGGRDFDGRGRPIRSPKGALFEMQVMPATARDPGFGLKPANVRDPADMNRLGREYLGVLQTKFGGNLPKMWGAYNAGPGRIGRLVDRYGDDWLRHAPPETQEYVRGNMRKLRGQ